MNEVLPPNASATPPADPERCRQILLDILSKPGLTNGEHEAAGDFMLQGWSDSVDSYHAAVLAAARWAFQSGALSIVSPGLRLVR